MNGFHVVTVPGSMIFYVTAFAASEIAWIFRHNGLMGAKL